MYGERRKRNIDMSRFERKDKTLSIFKDKNEEDSDEYQVDNGEYDYEEIIINSDEELEEAEEELNEEIEDDEVEDEVKKDTKQLYIDGKPFVPKQKKRKPTFEESHVRITTYLEKDIHMIVKMLIEQNQTSIKALINESVKAYLLSEFSDDTNQ